MLALVTGASSGIGRELARGLAARGHSLLLVARDAVRLTSLAEELERRYGVHAAPLPADLSRPDTPAAIAAACASGGWEVDVLVNNAGFGTNGPFAASDPATEAAQVQVNVAALTALTRLFLPGMMSRRRGGVLNVASTAAFQAGPWMAVYYAGKAYVVSFTEALAVELRGTGITASVLCPGPTRTEFQARAGIDLAGVPIAKREIMMDAGAVAEAGIRGFLARRTIIIPGTANRLGVLAVKLLPRALVRRVTAVLNRTHTL
jgi:hypothetical protein